jgi:pimeloyl-ACP methyl ester carboxylesterase
MTISENYYDSGRHSSFYLSSGPKSGPLIIFVHGWPELSFSWRNQLEFFGKKGWFAVAPDMRGYGRSSLYNKHEDYAQQEIVKDMVELFEHFDRDSAVWVGHDWGSPVVWNMALHESDKVSALASLCIPLGFECGVDELVKYVDRDLYPVEKYPKGQWDYQYFYQENFELARKEMEVDPYKLIKALFRKRMGPNKETPVFSAEIRARGGWFPPDGIPPDMPIDLDVISEKDAQYYSDSLAKTGFFGANSWYMNHDKNKMYNQSLGKDIALDTPVLFFHAEHDYICYTLETDLVLPMRARCNNLKETTVSSGHWMAQEKPDEVNQGLCSWLSCL